jgi:membrane protein required for colicin V production
MSTLDIAIILLICWSVYHGWKQGLLKEIISMVGFFIGLFVAFQLYTTFGDALAPHISSNSGVGGFFGKVIAFIAIWIIVPILLGIVGNILTKSLKGLHLGFPNSVGGMLVSLFKYLILMSFVLCAMGFVGIVSPEKKQSSHFYKPVTSIVKDFFVDKKKPQTTDPNSEKQDTVWINVHGQKKGYNEGRKE